MHIFPRSLHPSQSEILPLLGFVADEQTPPHLMRWNGHQLTLTFASDQEVTLDLVMAKIIDQAGARAIKETGETIKRLLKL